jgi:hypothetical protein
MSEHKHWRSLFARDEKFLGSWNLEKDGKYEQVVVHIEKFYQDTLFGSMGKEQKVVCKLKEFDKPLVVNRTNFKRLQQKFDSFDMNDYIGKPVMLTVEKVKSPDGPVDALRFSTRPVEVKKSLPALKDEDVAKVKEKILNGEMTLEKLKTIRSITKEQEDEIKSK